MPKIKSKSDVVKILIGPMQERDLEEVLAIEKSSFQTPWTRGMFLSELKANPYSYPVLARFPGQPEIIGYACFWILFEELHLMNLAVHPDHRRRGIGEGLVRWVLNMGQEKGSRIALLEVRISNDPAQRLYEKIGFKKIAVRPGYYRDPKEDALLMILDPLSVSLSSASGKGAHRE